MDHPLDCIELVELVTEYLEGQLDEHDRAEFERHLSVCVGCEVYVEQMRETIDATGHLDGEDVDPVVLDRLVDAFRGFHRHG